MIGSLQAKKLPSGKDVLQARQKNIVKSLAEIVAEGRHNSYMDMVRELSETQSFSDIAAAALYAAYGEIKEPALETTSEGRSGVVRLFMTIGRKDNIKVADIVKSITAESGVPHYSIGNIAVLDKYSFVEVPADAADKVIRSLDDMVMKGRRVRVQQAKDRR